MNKNAAILLAFFTIFIFLIVIFFYIFTRKIINQMSNINKNITLIANGNFDITIPVDTKDEVGQIANNINIMTNRIKELIIKERENEKIKNDIVSHVSHDLRTPLTSVIGYVEMMQKINFKDKETCDHCTDIILKKCDELRNLADDILEYTSIDFKGLNLKEELISLKDVIDQVIVTLIPTFEKYQMSFEIKAPNEKVYITGDISLIVRLFENIINNSIFYGKDGKKVNIEIEEIGSLISVKIKNYGNRIAMEDQRNIFEKFYRGEKSRSANAKGKGIGLAIAKSIVVAHKGSIKVVSSEAETIFEVVLPAYKKL
ncbi:MAG: sensor histidine kinase [Aminipila sp.]